MMPSFEYNTPNTFYAVSGNRNTDKSVVDPLESVAAALPSCAALALARTALLRAPEFAPMHQHDDVEFWAVTLSLMMHRSAPPVVGMVVASRKEEEERKHA